MNEIQQHYNEIDEKDRLGLGLGLLEKERTQQIITRYLGKSSSKILDVGGAAGVYAFWLASMGHEVSLIDPSEKHIQQAISINDQTKNKLASIAVGDARDLCKHENETFDCILFLGPLYHLIIKEDRLRALNECFRVLKKGGLLFAAGINRYASLYDGLSQGLIDDPNFISIMKQDLLNGQHRNPSNHPGYFTTAVFQLPVEMELEIKEAKFSLIKTLPVEGPLWFVNSFEDRWAEAEKRSKLLYMLESLEDNSIGLLLTLHYIAVARK
jgi:ubiquinone/menaquinone biosynthesis C-methylase UbiE